jgi:23S rRNA pseudouridine2605 synthase
MERLNKFLAHAGVGSRRHCDTLISGGRVKVDGVRVTDLGTKVDPRVHQIAVDDAPVRVEKPVYWAVNKPVGYLCTNDDPDGRPRAADLLPHVEQRVYTVGRLDEASEGLLLMTNDGDLAFHLMHPRFGISKTYLVLVAGHPSPAELKKLTDGIWLAEGRVKAKSADRIKTQGESAWLRIVLTEGKNREIRRMLAKSGHKVMKLRRVAIGPVKLDKLPKGKARRVSEDEMTLLRKHVELAKERIAGGGKRPTETRPEKADKPPRREKRGPAPFSRDAKRSAEKPPRREKAAAPKPAPAPVAPAKPPKKKSWGPKKPARPE